MSDQFMISNVVVNGTSLKGWVTHSINPGVSATLNAGASELDPSVAEVLRVEPVVSGGCLDLENLLDLAFDVAGTGHVIPHIPITANCDIWFTAVEAGAVHGAASKNIRGRITKGLLAVKSVANNGEGVAVATVEIHADFDGTNAPIAFTLNTTLAGAGGSPNLWTIRALKNGSAGTVLHKLSGIELDFGVNVQRQRPSNSIYATDSVVDGFRPVWRWATGDAATALSASGLSGAIAASGGLICYIGKYDDSVPGVAADGALALTLAAGSPWYTDGFPLGGAAPVELKYMAQGLGGTAIDSPPMAYSSAGVALPDESTAAAIFGPGPIKEAGAEKELLSGEVAFGQTWQLRGSASVPWPVLALLTRREPTITIQSSDLEYVASMGIAGRVISTSFYAYLRKYTVDGEPSDAITSHIAISCTDGLLIPSGLGGEHGQLVPGGFSVRPTGGLTLSVAATI